MIKVFVMSTCPSCAEVKELTKTDARFQLIDIGEHVRNLKEFLALRDNHPSFAPVRKRGTIGIPCFIQEDGSITFRLDEVQLPPLPEGASCNLDGTGC